MFTYKKMNPIAKRGTEGLSRNYQETDDLTQADFVLVRSADMNEVMIPDRVLAIARAGAGVNNIPLDECARRGIVVFNTPGANANGVKELVLAGMLLAARDVVGGINWAVSRADDPEIAKAAEKEKKQFAGSELSGKKLGVIGLGAIGVLVANSAVHLGMEVLGYDPYISVDAAWSLSRSIRHISDVNEIFKECDYITIHVPLTDETRGMIGREAISLMKPSAVILNFARDLLVDEAAVVEALEEDRLHRYVCDFPNPGTIGKKGVLITPHLGASTEESEENCAVMAVNEVVDFIENGNIRNSVNYPQCNMGKCESASRIAIYHKNVKKMINSFSAVLENYNIANLSNTSRGEYAYTLIDLEEELSSADLDALSTVDGVIRVRIVC